MPVWGAVLSSQQVGDLVSYLRAGLPAVAGATPVRSPSARATRWPGRPCTSATAASTAMGRTAGRRPEPGRSGQGHPAAVRRRLPRGVQHRRQGHQFIQTGSVLGKAPIASMPHWGGILQPAQTAQIVAYLKTLR